MQTWPQLLHDLEWWTDSTVFRHENKVVKKYKPHITLKDIEVYHSLHGRESREELIIPVWMELEFWWVQERQNNGFVREIAVRVLDLSQSEVSWEDGYVTVETDYIPWNSIHQFIGIMWMWEPREFIYWILEKSFTKRLGVNQLDWRNVKTSDINDGVVYWTVTDLACSIHDLLAAQK